jgi:hypothetical protein
MVYDHMMGLYAEVDYNLTLCPLQSRRQLIYPARVDLHRMPESTLFPSQGPWIWHQHSRLLVNISITSIKLMPQT